MKKVINTIVFVICIVLLSVNVEADEITVSDQIVDEGFVEETEDGLITLSSSQINIIWTVNAKIIKKTKGFKLKAGDEIVINIKVSPEKKKRIGIIENGIIKKYYETTTSVRKTIPITKADTYNVFVQNMTNTKINATGYYQKK